MEQLRRLRNFLTWAWAKLVDTFVDHWLSILLTALIASAASATVTKKIVEPLPPPEVCPDVCPEIDVKLLKSIRDIEVELYKCLDVNWDVQHKHGGTKP